MTIRMKLPSFKHLQEHIRRTFSATASYLPEIWTYWSTSEEDYYALPEEDTHKQYRIPRTIYASHPHINLATVKDMMKTDEISLMTSCTTKNVTRGILVCPEEWSHGIFQIVCFKPESYLGGTSYESCISVKFQIETSTPLSAMQLNSVPQDSFVDKATIRVLVDMFLMLLDDVLGESNRHMDTVVIYLQGLGKGLPAVQPKLVPPCAM